VDAGAGDKRAAATLLPRPTTVGYSETAWHPPADGCLVHTAPSFGRGDVAASSRSGPREPGPPAPTPGAPPHRQAAPPVGSRSCPLGLARATVAGLEELPVDRTTREVIRWHRTGFRLLWKWRNRPLGAGRRPIGGEAVSLIWQMSRANPLWGAPRIHGELLRLGFALAQRTVASARMPGSCHRPQPGPPSPCARELPRLLPAQSHAPGTGQGCAGTPPRAGCRRR
jgi:hypothetical protein